MSAASLVTTAPSTIDSSSDTSTGIGSGSEPAATPNPCTSFTVNLAPLIDALTTAGLALPSRPMPASLGGVLLAANHDELLVTAASWDTTITVRIPTRGGFGELLVDHAELTKLLAALTKGRRKAEIAELRATVTAANPAAAILELDGHRVPVTTYPLEDLLSVGTALPLVARLDRAHFTADVSRVLKAAGADETLPSVFGVKIDISDGGVTLAATDRFRMAVARIPAVTVQTSSTDRGAVVPAGLLAKITNRFDADRVRIGWERADLGTCVSLTCGAVTIVTRSTTEDFVKYSQHLPTEPTPYSLVADRAILREAAERAVAVGKAKREGLIQLDLLVTPLEISVLPVLSERGGEVTAPSYPAEITYPDNTDSAADTDRENSDDGRVNDLMVRFNAEYFLDALASFTAEEITLHLNPGMRPTTFTDTPVGLTDPAAFRHVLMPIRRES
jgi:DNA polymerase-3 subunit beta